MVTKKPKQRVLALGMGGMSALGSLHRGRKSWTRSIEVALVLVGPVIFSCVATADDCFPIEEPEPAVFDVGDLNGDGFADVVIVEPPTYGSEAGPAVAVSGANGSTLLVLVAPPGTQYFGMGVGRVEDLDGDGIADLAVASLRFDPAGEPIGLLHIYSAVDGTPIAVVSKADDSPFTAADVSLVGDLDASQAVDFADVSLLLDHLYGEGPSVDEVIADVDVNGAVDLADAVALTWQGGATLDEARVTTLVTQLNALVVDGPPPGQGGGTQAGLIFCAYCWVRCFTELIRAADCGDYCRAQFDACVANADDGFDVCDCEVQRRQCIPPCIRAVADAAGACGECVWECAPRPERP